MKTAADVTAIAVPEELLDERLAAINGHAHKAYPLIKYLKNGALNWRRIGTEIDNAARSARHSIRRLGSQFRKVCIRASRDRKDHPYAGI